MQPELRVDQLSHHLETVRAGRSCQRSALEAEMCEGRGREMEARVEVELRPGAGSYVGVLGGVAGMRREHIVRAEPAIVPPLRTHVK